MEPLTLEQLFELGGHHTIESEIERGNLSFSDSYNALVRRFGDQYTVPENVAAQLYQEVSNAANASRESQFGEEIGPLSYGRNPTLPQQYQYITIGSLPDPLDEDHPLSIPYTINSQVPLSQQAVIDQAVEELNNLPIRRDSLIGAQYADLFRRDLAFERLVEKQYGREAPIDIQIIGSYRRN